MLSLILDNPGIVAVPAFLSGQCRSVRTGTPAERSWSRADQVYANIVALLASKGCEPRSIIKRTTYLMEDDTH
jgi:hypothetical protein